MLLLLLLIIVGSIFYFGGTKKQSISQKIVTLPLVTPKPSVTPTANADSVSPALQSPSPTTNVSLVNPQGNCTQYQDKYFHICYPKSWRMLPEINKGPNDFELLSLQQSKTENDGTAFGNTYDIHVISNAKGDDASTFAKNDITTNWEQNSGPTYSPYPLNNLDAVIVQNINSGKGAWGPSVYVVDKTISVQLIAENPVDLSTDKYFHSVVSTFSFLR